MNKGSRSPEEIDPTLARLTWHIFGFELKALSLMVGCPKVGLRVMSLVTTAGDATMVVDDGRPLLATDP